MKIIDGHDVIEHAEVNGESREFIKKLTDYIEDADVVEPKGDLIGRADAIKAVSEPFDRKYWQYTTRSIRDTVKALKDIPSAEPKQEWIPCSERLPEEEFGTYLICTENGYMCSCRWTNDMYGLGQTEWSKWGWHIMDKPQYSVVGAWMPIEPWEGADDETD